MSIALENNQVSNGLLGMSKISTYKKSPILDSKDRTVENDLDQSCSSSSSSIGINSDDENDKENGEESEVQSKLTNTSFDSAVNALEQALPIRRGISKFYNGKSKSFASLTSCSSIQEITKPDNAYSRKRKNLLAYNLLYDKGRTSLLKSHSIEHGIAKRPTNSSRTTLAFAAAMNNHETTSINENEPNLDMKTKGKTGISPISPPSSPLPPRHPWRSFSVVDLQHCGVSASVVNSNLNSPLMRKRINSDYDEVS